MSKIKKALFSPAATVIAFVLAAGLLLFSGINGARAALQVISDYYATEVQMLDIGVNLLENDEEVAWRKYEYDTVTDGNVRDGFRRVSEGNWNETDGEFAWENTHIGFLLKQFENESVQPGKTYQEELRVSNTGSINQYVRVTIYKYWTVQDEKGNDVKDQSYDPSLIDLHLVNLVGDSWKTDAWQLDESASTPERTVLYYTSLLKSVAELEEEGLTNAEAKEEAKSELFADTITIDSKVATPVDTEQLADGTYRTIYECEGKKFWLDVKVDAVQENNAEDAVKSAWGMNVSVDEDAGTLRLVNG